MHHVRAKPGAGPGPHRHPYDEIQFVREGRGQWKVNGVEFEGKAGDIFVVNNTTAKHRASRCRLRVRIP